MWKLSTGMLGAGVFAILLGGVSLSPEVGATSVVEQGKAIAANRKKGNCMACHRIAGASQPGNIGPPLVGMKARYPDKARLRAQIWDSTRNNPQSLMPPFGRNRILTESEIDKVVDYILTL